MGLLDAASGSCPISKEVSELTLRDTRPKAGKIRHMLIRGCPDCWIGIHKSIKLFYDICIYLKMTFFFSIQILSQPQFAVDTAKDSEK